MAYRNYVAGMLVTGQPDHPQVLLIHKLRPAWQAGLLNLIGGKVEPGEEPIDAMVREFREETGYETTRADWRLFCHLDHVCREGIVDFYVANMPAAQDPLPKAMTDETVHWVDVNWIPVHHDQCMSNLRWLVPLGLDTDHVRADVLDSSL